MDKIRKCLKDIGKCNVAFVGDSLTSCEWVHPNWREIVEYVLKEELQKEFEDWIIPSWGIRCQNYGFDGCTTSDIFNLLPEKADMVLGLMGGNDPVLGIKVEETKSNLEKIFEKFKDSEIIWSTSLPDLRGNKRSVYEPYRQITKEVGGEKVIDGFEWYSQFDLTKFFTFKSEENLVEGIKEGEIDPIHPNQLGNAYIAKMFLEKIGVSFDPEKYIEETLKGEKLPKY